MLNKLYHKGAEIKSAFLNGVNVFGSSEVPVEPSEDMGLAKDYSGEGWYKATDTGTVFNKGVPALETHVFSDSPKEYVSVHTMDDARLYGERAATSNLTSMGYMFINNTSFNQDISSWDTSSVTYLDFMFYGATAFNQDISSWDTSSVTEMRGMFYNASEFTQDLSQWCVSNILVKPADFETGSALTPEQLPVWGTCPIGEDGSVPETPEEPNTLMGLREDYSGTGWYKATDTGTVFSKDVPALETMVFEDGGLEYVSVYTPVDAKSYGAQAATSNLTNIAYCFFNNASFNEDISSWDVSNVTDMSSAFYGALEFNQDISSWDVSSVSNMSSMFNEATSFNQDISSWDVSNTTSMDWMFFEATSFNQDISSWDVGSVTDMGFMFYNATSFNQDLSKWCVSLIPTKPNNFDLSTTAWDKPKPVWGTCPRGENLLS